MFIVITGAAGFLGQRVIQSLANRGSISDAAGVQRPIHGYSLIDRTAPEFVPGNASVHVGNIADPDFLKSCVPHQTTHVFHLAAVVSGQAEADFDIGMAVNVHATEALLALLRLQGHVPRLVFPSSVAVFGDAPKVIQDDTATLPRSSYGTQKVIGELMINDMSRKGFIDGISVRVPTVVVRPGAANAAASSFASAIIREPLSGKKAICPVSDDMLMWIASPDTVTKNLIHAADLPRSQIGFPRMVNLPGISASVAQMIHATINAGASPSLIDMQHDPAIEAIVGTWPDAMHTKRAHDLGFTSDKDISAIVDAYMTESAPR